MPQLGLFCTVAGALCAWAGLFVALARPQAPKAIRFSQIMTVVFCGLSFVVLMALVARADPRVWYAVKHAAPPTAGLGYRLAAVWAGQAGGLLLWGFETALVGLFIRPAAMSRAAGVLSAIEGCLLSMVALNNPFGPPEPGVSGGMNPLLLHPMMLIHPPMLFLGYALLAVPYAVTVGALIDGQPGAWPRQVWPWMLVAWFALTLGNGFGAEWAYKTFGWGGFWAWDPVENTSFVPWMLAAAAVHSLWLAQRDGQWLRAAALAAIASFLAVLYGSYLARSGALAGASVHAYVAGERLMQYALLTVLIGAAGAAVFSMVARWQHWRTETFQEVVARASPIAETFPPEDDTGGAHKAGRPVPEASDGSCALRQRDAPDSGQTTFICGGQSLTGWCTAAMALTALLVLVGMSLPMKGLNPTPALYNTVLMPLAVLMIGLLVALSVPRLPAGYSGLLAGVTVFVSISGIGMALQYGAGVEKSWLAAAQAIFAPVVLVFSAMMMLWSAWQFFERGRGILEKGADLAHFGVAALLAGAVLSGYGTASQKAYLVAGEEQTILGHFVSVMSVSRPSPEISRAEIYADGHTGVVEIERNRLFDVELRRAYIRRGLLKDLYVTPHGILTTPTQIGKTKVPPGAMVEVAVKPGMSLVWLGMLSIASGIALALRRRLRSGTAGCLP